MAVASLYLGLSPLAAQQTKGNIVEYFGKERVERVDEGMILHTFRQGYFLPVTAPSGYLFTTSDGLGWEIATGKFKAPSANDLTATNYGRTREAVQWTPIEADSTGKFANRALRRAYVLRNIRRINLRSPCSNRAEIHVLLSMVCLMRATIMTLPIR